MTTIRTTIRTTILASLMMMASTALNATTATATATTNQLCNVALNRVLDVRNEIQIMKSNYNNGIYNISKGDDYQTLVSLHKINNELTDLYHQCDQIPTSKK